MYLNGSLVAYKKVGDKNVVTHVGCRSFIRIGDKLILKCYIPTARGNAYYVIPVSCIHEVIHEHCA